MNSKINSTGTVGMLSKSIVSVRNLIQTKTFEVQAIVKQPAPHQRPVQWRSQQWLVLQGMVLHID